MFVSLPKSVILVPVSVGITFLSGLTMDCVVSGGTLLSFSASLLVLFRSWRFALADGIGVLNVCNS